MGQDARHRQPCAFLPKSRGDGHSSLPKQGECNAAAGTRPVTRHVTLLSHVAGAAQHHTATHRTTPYHTIPHRTTPHAIAPHRNSPHTAPPHTAPHRIVPHRTALHHTTPHCTAPQLVAAHGTTLHRTVPYCTRQCRAMHNVLCELSHAATLPHGK